MQNDLNRAKQFLPFDALKGFKNSLRLAEKYNNKKIELSFDDLNSLNRKIINLKKGMKVKITYYYNFEYIETIGIIKRIDFTYKYIYLLDSKIFFDDILDITFLQI